MIYFPYKCIWKHKYKKKETDLLSYNTKFFTLHPNTKGGCIKVKHLLYWWERTWCSTKHFIFSCLVWFNTFFRHTSKPGEIRNSVTVLNNAPSCKQGSCVKEVNLCKCYTVNSVWSRATLIVCGIVWKIFMEGNPGFEKYV